MVFARLSTPKSASAPYRCYPLLSRFEYIDRRTPRTCAGSAARPQNSPFTYRDLHPHLTHSCSGPHPKRHLDRFSRFCRARHCDQSTDLQTDRQTDGQTTLFVTTGHIATAAMRHDNNNDNVYGAVVAEKPLREFTGFI